MVDTCVGGTRGLTLPKSCFDVVDDNAEVMDAGVVEPLAKLIVAEFQDGDVERAVGEEHARRPRRLVRFGGIEPESLQLAKAERRFVEFVVPP